MPGRFGAALALFAALLVFCPLSTAADPTGAIKGKVVDDKGLPLSGAYLYVSSPAALGIANYVTSKTGRYIIVGLTPGTYKIVTEMPGFKTISVDGVVLSAGATATLNFKMEPSDIEEELALGRPGPALDWDSSRAAVILDRELIARLPLPRDFTALLGLVPGLVFDDDRPGMRASLNGSPFMANVLVQDGVNVSHPVDAQAMGRINVDLVDEVVIETAGHAAQHGPVQGGTITIVHRPASSSPQASLSYSVSGKGMVDSLWTAEEVAEMPGAAAPALKREHDLSLTFGAPVLEDMAWLFGNVRYKTQGSRTPFRYWTDPLGVRHFVYDYAERELSGLFKLSMSVLDKFKGVLEFGYSGVSEPVYIADVDRLRPESSTRKLDGENVLLGRGSASYIVDQSTRIDLSAGYAMSKQALILNSTGAAKPQYYDVITGYNWGSGCYNDRESANRLRASVVITRLQDRFLGLPHHLVAGGEYETAVSLSSVWKADNLIYNYAAGSPYTFGLATSPSSGNTVGKGLIGFWIAPKDEAALEVRREVKKLGFFLQDTITIAGRISLTAGLRFDRAEARFPAVTKGSSGNAVASSIGDSLIDPILGYNLYGQFSLGQWDKPIVWNSLSPRAGLSIDLFGSGRTILKASYARLPEDLGLGYSQDLAQIDPWKSHDFLWYDEDGDGLVGSDDTFVLQAYDFRVYASGFFRQAVDADLKAPVIEEWTAGLEQEIFRGLTLSARYISRRHANIIGNVLYDPSTGAHWWRAEDAPDGWWVPFSTVVPGTDEYADVPVTLQLRSATAPAFFERIENVPELKATYRSAEFSFRKKMSHNWQLFGSLTWNRSTGTTSLASPWSAGSSSVLLRPNAFINIAATDRLLQDRPLVARLAATVRFGWDIFASFLFKAQSGAPWARTVTILPPSDWAAAHGADTAPVTVYLESPGSRRFNSWKNMDIRLEKEFTKTGRSMFAVSVDVFNLLGDKYRTLDLNDAGTWAPEGEGAGPGTRVLSGTYKTYSPLWGTRVVRLNLSLKF